MKIYSSVMVSWLVFLPVILIAILMWGLLAGLQVKPASAAPSACVPGPHGGTISADQTWCLTDSPHTISTDVIVSEGVTLTIEPGVNVVMAAVITNDRDLIVHGTLIAQGTESLPIRITSGDAAPARGDWGKIFFGDYSENNLLDYVTIEYGGYYQSPMVDISTSSITIDHSTIRRSHGQGMRLNNVSPTILNTLFEDNDGSALYLAGGSCFPVLGGLSASGNAYDAIGYDGATMSQNYTWGDTGIPNYRLYADIDISAGVTLTITPGTRVYFTQHYNIWPGMNVMGSLVAKGTETDDIRFTSGSDTPGKNQWGHIYFDENGTGSVIDYATIEYGGYYLKALVEIASDEVFMDHITLRRCGYTGIRIVSASPTIQNTDITDCDGSAIYVDGTYSYPQFSGLSASINDYDSITINGGTYAQDYTWGGVGIPLYRILQDVTVNQGVKLTVAPGTTVRFQDYSDDLLVKGTLYAKGTESEPILFTSDATSPGPGNWGRIYLQSTSQNNVLVYATLEYGGGMLVDEVLRADTSSLSVQHCTITASGDEGIRLNGGAPLVMYNSIFENNGDGLVNDDAGITAYARCNWWGDDSGPYNATLNPAGQGDQVSDGVIFSPWLTAPDGGCTFYLTFIPLTRK